MRNIKVTTFAFVFLLTGISYAQEIHTQSNAASIANEANAVTGWTPQYTNITSVSVESNDVYQGSYAIRIQTVSDGSSRGKYSFPTIADTQYKIVIYAKKLSPNAGFWAWKGFSDFVGVDMVGTDWKQYEFTLTASGTEALIKVYAGAPSVTGEAVLIDAISIQELDGSAPTAPTLSSTGHTDTTADLSWSGATDNVGVTGYIVYQNNVVLANNITSTSYQVTGLSAATAYDFKVRALDADGNESGDSNIVSVTTTSGSGGGSGSTSSIWSESGSTASYSGEVAIGRSTVPSGYKMAIDGKLITEEVRVEASDTWPDYVFEEDYELPTLDEIQKHIEENGHLPNVPSAQEVQENGIEVGAMNKLLLEKIEELTLYLIKLKEERNEDKMAIESLEKSIKQLQESNYR